jgi:hypothetical protein
MTTVGDSGCSAVKALMLTVVTGTLTTFGNSSRSHKNRGGFDRSFERFNISGQNEHAISESQVTVSIHCVISDLQPDEFSPNI